MSNPESSAEPITIETVFAALRAYYGRGFDLMWQCPAGVDLAEHAKSIKTHWTRELRSALLNPAAIRHAFDHLPPRAPNLIEFKALCRDVPNYFRPALAAPHDPVVVARARAGLCQVADRLRRGAQPGQ